MTSIKNIIFDLGAVILNLDPLKTESAFAKLFGEEDYSEIKKRLIEQDVFNQFEVGAITGQDFLNAFEPKSTISNKDIAIAWSAMLLDLPATRIETLKSLKRKGYRLFLFSNTNSIHLYDFREIVAAGMNAVDFDSLFEKAYYSHLVGLRKPDESVFEFILNENGLQKEESIFIDDNAENVASANRLGIQAFRHSPNSDLEKAVEQYLKTKI